MVPLRPTVGLTAASIFAGIGALHVYWAIGGARLAAAVIPVTAGGTRLLHPSRAATLAVAALLLLASGLTLLLSGFFPSLLPRALVRVGGFGLGAILALRAIGEFHYVGFFKHASQSHFARMDTWLYSPLCAALAAAVLWLAARR